MLIKYRSRILNPSVRIVNGFDLETYLYRYYKSIGYSSVVRNALNSKEMDISLYRLMSYVLSIKLEVSKNIPIRVTPLRYKVMDIEKGMVQLYVEEG